MSLNDDGASEETSPNVDRDPGDEKASPSEEAEVDMPQESGSPLGEEEQEDSEFNNDDGGDDGEPFSNEGDAGAPKRAKPKQFSDDETAEDDEGDDEGDQAQLQGDRPHFPPVGPRSKARVQEVWVEPPGFEPAHASDFSRDARVFILQGTDHAGKLAAAVKLCYLLSGGSYPDGSIRIYRRRAIEPLTLLEVVESDYWPPDGSFVIVRDAFDKSISLGELDGAELDQLTQILLRKSSFLLITTEIEPFRLAALDARKLILGRVGYEDLREILENHLVFYQSPDNGGLTIEMAAEVRQSWDDLAGILRTPDLINQLCRRIIEEQIRDRSGLRALADEIGKLAIVDLRSWFDKLALDTQLFVMMAYLFEGIDLGTLEKLYLDAVARLHQEGAAWMRDSRRLCLLYLQEAIGPDGVDDESVEFADAAVRRQVAWQVGNRRLLLSSILSPVVAEAARLHLWREAGRRAILGVALGKLGIHDRRMFTESLDILAKCRSALPGDARNSFAAIPGYAMTESLRREPASESSVVLGTLERWVGSGEPDLLWTAGAAIWRVYHAAKSLEGRGGGGGSRPQTLAKLRRYLNDMVLAYGRLNDNVLQRLRKEAAAGKSDGKEAERVYRKRLYEISQEGKNCASFALERIGRVDAQGMVNLSLEWIKGSEKKLKEVALRAARLTFHNFTKTAQPPSLERYQPILGLLQAVIAEAQPVALVTRAAFGLAKWLRSPDWREALFVTLLDLANHGNSQCRARLREALARYWSKSLFPEAREIASTLIERSYLMAGVLTDLPDLGRCLLILDSDLVQGSGSQRGHDGEAQRKIEHHEGALLQILAMIEARMNVAVLLLGDRTTQERENGPLRLTTNLPLQRLMKPGVQIVASEEIRMVLLLTAGPVIDLEDALDSISADHKLVIAASCDLEVPLGTELLCIGRDLSARDLVTIEAKLRLICARAQAALDPAGWEPLLERLGVNLAELDATPEATLAAWAAQLGEIPVPGGHDPAKKILCALLRLAVANLETCLRIVRAWLIEGTDLQRPMAAAVAVSLFRAVIDAPGIWGGLSAQRTFDELASPLARSGKDGTDTMLEIVERWLADPVLAEILAGAIEDGRCRLLRWAEEAAPQQIAAFQKALEPFRKSVEDIDLGPSREILDAVFDRLRIRLAMGRRPRPLPPLAAGESYAVIVFDAAARWGPLAAELFRRFNKPLESRKPLLYRLGERWPSWVAGDPDPKPADLSPVGVRLPRLLGPILRELSPASVSFLVVLAGEMWIDAEDWLSSPWRARIITHRKLADDPLRAEWVALPGPLDQEKDEVDLMATYLKQQLVKHVREGI